MATRSTIRQRARIRADQDGSNFPTDAQYNLLIDEAAKDVWFDLVQAGWPPDFEDWTVAMNGSSRYLLGNPRTMAMAEAYGGLAWIDDGTDPSDKNDWTCTVINHTGSPRINITFDDLTKVVTIDFSSNPSPATTTQHLIDELAETGRIECTATGIAVLNTAPTSFGFSGGSAGSDPVAFVHGVYRNEGSSRYALKRLNEGQRAVIESHTAGLAEHYSLSVGPGGTYIRLYPSGATGSVLVQLVREYVGFSGDYDIWVGPARSDELIVLRAAAKGCRKEGNDQAAAQLDKEYDFLLAKVQNMAGWLDLRNPPMIADVNSPARRDLSDWDVDLLRF